MRIYRVVVRGHFAGLDGGTRDRLLADVEQHHIFRSAFTADGESATSGCGRPSPTWRPSGTEGLAGHRKWSGTRRGSGYSAGAGRPLSSLSIIKSP